MDRRDRALAAAVAIMWGSNFVSIDIGLRYFPPLFFASLRYAVIAVPTILLVSRPAGPTRWLVGYGLTFGALQFGLLFVAINLGMPAGLSALILQAAVPLTVLLSVLLLHERVDTRRMAGVIIALGGLGAIGYARAEIASILPMMLMLAAATALALSNLCSKVAKPEDPLRFILWSSVIPPLPLLGLSWWLEGPAAGWSALLQAATPAGWPGLVALAFIAVFGTVVGTAIWTGLLSRNPAHVVAPYSLLVPVIGMLAAAALLKEQPGLIETLAGVAIIGGVLLGTPTPRRTAAMAEVGAMNDQHGEDRRAARTHAASEPPAGTASEQVNKRHRRRWLIGHRFLSAQATSPHSSLPDSPAVRGR